MIRMIIIAVMVCLAVGLLLGLVVAPWLASVVFFIGVCAAIGSFMGRNKK